MNKRFNKKILVSGLILLLLGAGFLTVSGTTSYEKQKTEVTRGNTFNVTAGQPTQTGTWTIYVSHTGTTPSGTPYTGTWEFSIPTNSGMTPAQKAAKMKEEINKKNDCPLSATSSGANVKVTASNGNINSWSSKSTDGQMVHGNNPSLLACSFMGTPTTGSVTVDVGGLLAMTLTDGKTLMQIHNDLFAMLLGLGVPTMIDPSGLALYIQAPFPNIGLGSDDNGLGAYGVFYFDPGSDPFDGIVAMLDTFAGNSGSSVAVEFHICNFIFVSNSYHVTATDQLGWNITPLDLICDLLPGESDTLEFQVEIPPTKSSTTNIMNVTATSISMPWIVSSGYVKIIVNNKPDTPVIDGLIKGKPGKSYTYGFNATDPEGNNISYYIDWGDNTTTGWVGPYLSGDEITQSHTWSTKGTYIIKAKVKDSNGAESDWGELSVTMPYTPPQFPLLEWLMNRFPHAFPILRHLMEY